MRLNKCVAMLSIAALAAVAAGAAAAEGMQSMVVTPGKGVSFYMGTKHGITHFLPGDGACKLTVAIGENPDMQGMNPAGTSRVIMSVVPGKPAKVETSEGQSLVFSCSPDLQSMKLEMPPDFKYTPKG